MGARAHGRRVERRLRRGAGRTHGARRHGHGHRGLAAHPLGPERHLDDQAHARPRLAARDRAARAEPRPRRADGAHARGLRAAPGGHGRRAAGRAAGAARAGPSLSRACASRCRRAPGQWTLDADVADGFDAAIALCRTLGAELVEPPAPPVRLDVGDDFLDVLCAESARLPPPLRRPAGGLPPVDCASGSSTASRATVPAERYLATQQRRETDGRRVRRVARRAADLGLLEPTVPCVAPERGSGYDARRHATTS